MSKPNAKPHGQIRQSQLVSMFGPGAMMDLPNNAVLIGGLDDWTPGDSISEPRLAIKVARLLGLPSVYLRTPPRAEETGPAPGPRTGIKVWEFPEWFVTQDAHITSNTGVRSRMLVHRRMLTKKKFVDNNRVKHSVVPVRFVRACRSGHIGDIDWRIFAHSGRSDCTRLIWFDERGTSGDISEIWIRCECGATSRSLIAAINLQNLALGTCNGLRPWLGPSTMTRESCGEPNRLLVRTASNAYFSQVMSVISLPERDETVKQQVDLIWEFVSNVEDIGELKYERKKDRVNKALEGLKDEEVFAEIQARKGAGTSLPKSVKLAELETLVSTDEEIGEDKPDGTFFARRLPNAVWQDQIMAPIEHVTLVHRLREVTALVGFTRFEALAPDIEGELEMGVRRAALAPEMTWVPAIENKGEGIFLQFKQEYIDTWMNRADVKARGKQLLDGFEKWRKEHPHSKREFPGLPYLMLHSFAHLLITSVSLECGYPASSIKERIYAIPEVGYGILLYTGSTDSEGTLGGLIEVGRKIHLHVRAALDLGELCSNDPVCAQHAPENIHECRFLHGAACHGCVLIAETSCEQHNSYLDRALVVPTLANLGVEFFARAKSAKILKYPPYQETSAKVAEGRSGDDE
ncbi:MAG: DUF1998 domain-containing protein [Candidatus Obscuribacterales bacterium]|nr:DUF1998 domain-containing protein [Candidatus Obscuribacterales bacterium]